MAWQWHSLASFAFAMASAPGQLVVRDGRREDLPTVHRMIYELAAYEGMPDGPQLSVEDLAADGFDSQPPWFFLLIAELEHEVVGYALCNRAYSSWTRRALYIEDLYVVEAKRREGVGRALLREVCARALAAGVTRIDWHVLENNHAARALYGRLGARDLCRSEGRLALRLDEPRILAVAEDRLLAHQDLPRDAP